MKVEVKEQETFQPITLIITIESEEELCNLWHRMNAGHGFFKTYRCFDDLKYSPNSNITLFNQLDIFIHKYNLKK
jgi:hypothetical protein